MEKQASIFSSSPFSKKDMSSESLVADILRLTEPSDYVMDSKGETIFRPRPFYYVLETLTQERMKLGLIPDTIAEEMVKTRTCVCLLKRLPQTSLQWVERYFVPVNDLPPLEQVWVAGCFLAPAAQTEPTLRRFEVAIPTQYVVTSPNGPVSGTMDGVDCSGPVFLNPGTHTFSCTDSHPLAILWAQAAKNGFNPFHNTHFFATFPHEFDPPK